MSSWYDRRGGRPLGAIGFEQEGKPQLASIKSDWANKRIEKIYKSREITDMESAATGKKSESGTPSGREKRGEAISEVFGFMKK